MRFCRILLLTCPALFAGGLLLTLSLPCAQAADPLTASGEYVTVSPVVANGVLYVASFSRPGQAGHLRAIDLAGDSAAALWDAADRMPAPGTGAAPGDLPDSDPPQYIDPDNQYRTLFTTQTVRSSETLMPFTALQAASLQTELGVISAEASRALINSVRGRSNTSAELVDGTGDAAYPLWGISRSTPAVAGRSFLVNNAAGRQQVVYVGAEDGMLHAFHGGHWDSLLNRYNQTLPQAGQELWAYIPGSMLPFLGQQPFDDAPGAIAVHIDGSPFLGDLFLDWNGDGRRTWRTLLVGTGSIPILRQGVIFALDVSDPCQPVILWEHPLPGNNTGLTRGVVIGSIDADTTSPRIFLTAGLAVRTDLDNSPDPSNGSSGIQALALDILTGTLLWQWQASYANPQADFDTTPAQPALMDIDGDGRVEYLVFGDMLGRLWAIAADKGEALGGAPVYTLAEGAAQPIGAGVATHGRVAIFGTGGSLLADENATYAIHAVEILPVGGQLLWSYLLAPGEKIWSTPAVDRFGRIYFAASTGYPPEDPADPSASSGRLVLLDKTGQELTSTWTDHAIAGRVQIGSGVAVAVTLSGRVYRFGTVRLTPDPEAEAIGPFRLFSWRLR
jgi:outer membrane protein assembly factor BamB